MTQDDTNPGDGSKPTVHLPVLLGEVLAGLVLKPGMIVVDGTVGAAGHAAELVRRILPGGMLIGLDRDPAMLALAELAVHDLPVSLIHESYSHINSILESMKIDRVHAILLDLGLSSDQLGWTERGFSFQADGPLDMRFDQTSRKTAATLIQKLDADALADIFYQYGEERHSRRIARAIVESRRKQKIETAAQLAEIVRKNMPGKWGPIDPATRVFQALRIAVNDELSQLDSFLENVSDLLEPGGRVAIISFHSLEDRAVKHAFRENPKLDVLTKKPIRASEQERAANPRSRSAKLRIAQRRPNPTEPEVSI